MCGGESSTPDGTFVPSSGVVNPWGIRASGHVENDQRDGQCKPEHLHIWNLILPSGIAQRVSNKDAREGGCRGGPVRVPQTARHQEGKVPGGERGRSTKVALQHTRPRTQSEERGGSAVGLGKGRRRRTRSGLLVPDARRSEAGANLHKERSQCTLATKATVLQV